MAHELHHAAKRGDLNQVNELLRESLQRVDINQPDHKGWTPLMYAVDSPEAGIEIMRTLLCDGANIDHTSACFALSDLRKLAVLRGFFRDNGDGNSEPCQNFLHCK